MTAKKLIKAISMTLHDDDGHCSDFICCEARKAYEDVSVKIIAAIKKSGFSIQDKSTGKRASAAMENAG